MHPGNTFNANRFLLLFKQNMIHHSRFLLQSIIAFIGGLFILLFIIQIFNSFRTPSQEFYFIVFIIVFTTTGMLSAGTAFPALREKETTHNFLMLPASMLEKFLLEFLNRIVLFILFVPLLYWAVYNLEGYLAHLFLPGFIFRGHALMDIPDLHLATQTASDITYLLIPFAVLLMLIIPFTGTTMFRKSPLIKTLFAVAIIFFFNLFLVYFFLKILDFNQFYPTTPILYLRHFEDGLVALTIGCMIFSAGFIVSAYLKLTEKEA